MRRQPQTQGGGGGLHSRIVCLGMEFGFRKRGRSLYDADASMANAAYSLTAKVEAGSISTQVEHL